MSADLIRSAERKLMGKCGKTICSRRVSCRALFRQKAARSFGRIEKTLACAPSQDMVIDIHQHFYERSPSNLDSGFARFLFFCYSSGDFFDSSEPRGTGEVLNYIIICILPESNNIHGKKIFLGRIYRRGSRPCILSPLTPLFLFDARGIGNVIQYAGMLQSSRISVRNPTDCPMTSISNENSVLHNRFSRVRCCVLRQVLPCFSLALCVHFAFRLSVFRGKSCHQAYR